jgi:hypothetical protein
MSLRSTPIWAGGQLDSARTCQLQTPRSDYRSWLNLPLRHPDHRLTRPVGLRYDVFAGVRGVQLDRDAPADHLSLGLRARKTSPAAIPATTWATDSQSAPRQGAAAARPHFERKTEISGGCNLRFRGGQGKQPRMKLLRGSSPGPCDHPASISMVSTAMQIGARYNAGTTGRADMLCRWHCAV